MCRGNVLATCVRHKTNNSKYMNNTHDSVLALVTSGFSVIPITEGEKKPHRILGKGHNLLTQRSTREEVEKWISGGVRSWGIANGAVSGNLVTLDFDEKNQEGLYDLWYAKLSDDLKAVVDTCAISTTRNKGHHVRYRTETSQPTVKLSRRFLNEKVETTSEVRGEGSYALIPPSAGYTLIQGDLKNLPLVTDEMHEAFIDILRIFNEIEDEPATEYEYHPTDAATGNLPGHRLNALMSWDEILTKHGWVNESGTQWRRPGKKAGEGTSASTDYAGVPMLYVFSSAAAPFVEKKGYSKFHVFALLNHEGDFKAAAWAAAEMYPAGEEHDWDEIFSTEVLKSMANLPAISMAKKLLKEMPEEAWSIGWGIFKLWNELRSKPSETRFLKSLWTNTGKSEIEATKLISKEPRVRIAKCPVPEKPVTFEEWADTVSTNFPDLRFASEVALSTVSQFLIKDITNPFALVLVDVPSSGKTIAINFFDDIPELTYATDKFTPASFVSNASNVSKEELADIDLLPRIQYRMFLIRDFATLFSKREDDLNEMLGILTRVLDGEGLNTDSGVHGQRQYNGEYLFMLLGASTPISPRVMKVMGNLGSRLFFLSINSSGKSESELAAQIADQSYKEKEKTCRLATRDFLYGLWNTYPQGIDWDRKGDDRGITVIIARCAKLLASLRGAVNVWDDTSLTNDYKYSTPMVERPDRLNQLFNNLARGHALVRGRTQIAVDDLRAIIELCVDGAPTIRAKLFKKLIEHGGTMTTSEIERGLNCSKPTALKEMKTLQILGVCSQYENTGRDNEIALLEDFQWFLSDECMAIRGVSPSKDEVDPEEGPRGGQ
jgi:hypothetical protein